MHKNTYTPKKDEFGKDHVKVITKNKITNPEKHILFKSDKTRFEPSSQETATEINNLDGFGVDGTGGKDTITLKDCKNASVFGAGSKDKLILSNSTNIDFYGNWNSKKHYDNFGSGHNFLEKIFGKSKSTDEVIKDNKSTCQTID
jgi:hypothetical protein